MVPHIPGSIIVNQGEMLSRFSNGSLPAPVHRVKANNAEERYSLVSFWAPNFETILPSLEAKTGSLLSGEYYLKRNNPTAAMRRFKKIKSSTKVSNFLPEVSYRLIESFILVGLFGEAKSEKTYMQKKFPNNSWTKEATDLIDKSGLY